ncbi:hypothetical protein HYU11_05105 [Candidatus Woesearchaeota archaeon]|nr:hypothetical protein [Candidatus Woesearchaeota archaeon]
MGFIKINGRMLDAEEHRNDVSMLRHEIAAELSELVEKYGFDVVRKEFKGYNCLFICCINVNMGLLAEIRFKKR